MSGRRKPPGGGDEPGKGGDVIPIKPEDRPRRTNGGPAKAGKRTSPATVIVAERRADAIGLRRAGLSYTKIAETLAQKYHNPRYNRASAFRDIREALDRIIEEPARELKAEELDRLAALQSAHWAAAMRGDIPATLAILRIMMHRAKLVGLESPIKHDISGTDVGEVTVNLSDPAELQQAGLDLLDDIAAKAAERRRGSARKTNDGA